VPPCAATPRGFLRSDLKVAHCKQTLVRFAPRPLATDARSLRSSQRVFVEYWGSSWYKSLYCNIFAAIKPLVATLLGSLYPSAASGARDITAFIAGKFCNNVYLFIYLFIYDCLEFFNMVGEASGLSARDVSNMPKSPTMIFESACGAGWSILDK